MKDELKVINEDELIGFIARKTEYLNLTYEEINAVLEAHLEFLFNKELAEFDDGELT